MLDHNGFSLVLVFILACFNYLGTAEYRWCIQYCENSVSVTDSGIHYFCSLNFIIC